jgi:hypothetical protein
MKRQGKKIFGSETEGNVYTVISEKKELLDCTCTTVSPSNKNFIH